MRDYHTPGMRVAKGEEAELGFGAGEGFGVRTPSLLS